MLPLCCGTAVQYPSVTCGDSSPFRGAFCCAAKLAVSTEAFPQSGEGVEERSDETDEGAPADAANGKQKGCCTLRAAAFAVFSGSIPVPGGRRC